jgi:hypothetical protein
MVRLFFRNDTLFVSIFRAVLLALAISIVYAAFCEHFLAAALVPRAGLSDSYRDAASPASAQGQRFGLSTAR